METAPQQAPLKLWKHQEEVLSRALPVGYYGLFFEAGCLGPHSEVKITRAGASRIYTIEQAFRLFNNVELTEKHRGWSDKFETFVRTYKNESIGLHKIKAIVRSGEKEVLRLQVKRQKALFCTPEHPIMTKEDGLKLSIF